MATGTDGIPQEKRLAALVPAAILFALVLPVLLVWGGLWFDQRVPLARISWVPFREALGLVVTVLGLCFAGWTVWYQYTVGRGTPIPKLPPQRLLVDGPYSYCRNPMTFGTTVEYLGLSLLFGSSWSIVFTVLFTALLLAYVRLFEEKELEQRFGGAYRQYKDSTPFFLPRGRPRHTE